LEENRNGTKGEPLGRNSEKELGKGVSNGPVHVPLDVASDRAVVKSKAF
jgi:hypothetical protein